MVGKLPSKWGPSADSGISADSGANCCCMTAATPSLSLHSEHPIGVVFSGGGARGAFQVGVWEVLRLDKRGFTELPDVISGTSAGAINAALIGAGLSPKQILDFWLSLADDPPVRANHQIFKSLESAILKLVAREPLRSLKRRGRSARILKGIVARHFRAERGNWLAGALEFMLTARFDSVSRLLESIRTAHLFSIEPMRARLRDAMGSWAITNPGCRLAINTVDVETGKVVRFVNYEPQKHAEADSTHYRYGPITVDMVLASAAIPLLFNPVRVGQGLHWDGGLLVNTPIAPAVALGAKRIVPVLVTAGGTTRSNRPLHLGAAVERLADAFLENAYNTDRKLLLERNKLAEALPARNLRVIELYEAIRPASSDAFDAGSYLYFERTEMMRMYEAGKASAKAWLAAGPCLDTHPGPHLKGEKPVRAPLVD